ncbi:MAG: spore germination protein, partial [Lachnospiraceae bacterium]|nr:spore germination protein [Lachnospiraceae bacterium]
MYQVFEENKKYMSELLHVNESFDLVSREVLIGDKNAVFYFVNGFCDDDLMQKIMQFLMGLKADEMPQNAAGLNQLMPYIEVEVSKDFNEISKNVLSGLFAIIIEGFDECILIDARSYPARSVSEPEKDKGLRGSKDSFVETIICNTALIRRRIRSTDLRMEVLSAGKASKTDIVLCYMDSRVDKAFLKKIRDCINNIKVDALTMNQESLAECLFKSKWYNP